VVLTDQDIILDLQEDNRLLSSKIDVYKDEIQKLKEKLEYSQKLFTLYESIMECSKNENLELSLSVKTLTEENESFKKNL
jgi:hypothetical protein